MSLKVLILGINGFVGHRLTEHILSRTDWRIVGIDLFNSRLSNCLQYPELHFYQGDITEEQAWLSQQMQHCDVILPLLSLTKILDSDNNHSNIDEKIFNTHISIVEQARLYQKRVVFPDCSQRLTEIIMTQAAHHKLNFTLFRAFNWIGPKQDDIFETKSTHFNLVSRFISDIIHQRDIDLIHEEDYVYALTYIDDAVEALVEIIENKNNLAAGHMFNIANPNNTLSTQELAKKMISFVGAYPKYREQAEQTQIICSAVAKAKDLDQIPSIELTQKYLGWTPKTSLDVALHNILDSYLS